MTKILHTADNHLRHKQYGRADRGLDFFNGLLDVLRVAKVERVDAILNAGDLLDSTRPTARVMDELREVHERLIALRLTMYTISGNHDLTDPHWSSILTKDPDGYGIVCSDNTRFHVGDLEVLALPYMDNQALLSRLADEEPADILMWHGAVREFVGFPTDSALSIEDFPVNKFRRVLLGDIHVHEELTATSGSIFSYPGSTELCNKGEPLVKHVDIFEGPELTRKPVELKTRRALTFNIRADEDVTQVIQEVKPHLPENPMVFVKHDPDITGVFSRLVAVIDPDKCLLRVERAPRRKSVEIQTRDREEALPVVAFLGEAIPAGTPLHTLGEVMLDPQSDPMDALDRFVEERVGGVCV